MIAKNVSLHEIMRISGAHMKDPEIAFELPQVRYMSYASYLRGLLTGVTIFLGLALVLEYAGLSYELKSISMMLVAFSYGTYNTIARFYIDAIRTESLEEMAKGVLEGVEDPGLKAYLLLKLSDVPSVSLKVIYIAASAIASYLIGRYFTHARPHHRRRSGRSLCR